MNFSEDPECRCSYDWGRPIGNYTYEAKRKHIGVHCPIHDKAWTIIAVTVEGSMSSVTDLTLRNAKKILEYADSNIKIGRTWIIESEFP